MPYARASPVVVCGPEVAKNEDFYVCQGVVCKFNSLWPSLLNLHEWVFISWKPIVSGQINLYPSARGFFFATCTSFEDRD